MIASFADPLEGELNIRAAPDYGCFILGLGFVLTICSDDDLQAKVTGRYKPVKVTRYGTTYEDMISPKRIQNDVINAAFLSSEIDYLFNEKGDEIKQEFPPQFNQLIPLVAVFPNGMVESRTETDIPTITHGLQEALSDKEDNISLKYYEKGADHWLIYVLMREGEKKELSFVIYAVNYDESEKWRLRPEPEGVYSKY